MREDIQEDLDRIYEDVQKRHDGPSSKGVRHIQERPDGSSDGLPEDLKIHQYNEDGSYEHSECLEWSDLDSEGTLGEEGTGEELFQKNEELTAVQLVEVFNVFSEMGILEKRTPILNKLKQKDLQKLNKLYEMYKNSDEN